LPDWCTELIGIEQALLQNQVERALPRLVRVHRQPATGYIPYYQVDRLLRHGATDQAAELLRAYGSLLQPDEAGFLRLRIYEAKGWPALVKSESDTLLGYEMAPRIVAQFCALLITYPDAALFARYADRFAAANLPVNADTVSLYQATYLAAVAVGDTSRAGELVTKISQYTSSDARVLRGLGELLKRDSPDPRLARILPLVPLPTEVIYAILDQQTAMAPASK
jgi:hypothetical protein